MENVLNNPVESRRSFLKKTAYMAPILVTLGSLDAFASGDKTNTKGCNHTASSLSKTNSKTPSKTSSKAITNSKTPSKTSSKAINELKAKVNNVGVDTHGGSEKDITNSKAPKGNNGWGNGDQKAPGNSLSHNNAENS
jgi:hypothetical protein